MNNTPIFKYGADDWGSDSEEEYVPGTPSPRPPPRKERKETILDKKIIIGFILGYLFRVYTT